MNTTLSFSSSSLQRSLKIHPPFLQQAPPLQEKGVFDCAEEGNKEGEGGFRPFFTCCVAATRGRTKMQVMRLRTAILKTFLMLQYNLDSGQDKYIKILYANCYFRDINLV
ncbi:hypothetical protein CKAN_02479500 [Cinnamomum micranthum f. kanehirae]|uniref:Uncharacterized protein n=1 Tax=Cinnamomum micranthum f. kanehirae TaxID=337451 RepID=A0A443PXF6_9MAGN|nr:hypothetical protein CKAN_02479500 [Cinnamomum micranthum f. kanehirae]